MRALWRVKLDRDSAGLGGSSCRESPTRASAYHRIAAPERRDRGTSLIGQSLTHLRRAMLTLAGGAGVMLGLAMLAAPLRAEPWGSVFAAETDSAFFLMEDGDLVRAPFHLNGGDTFWVCP